MSRAGRTALVFALASLATGSGAWAGEPGDAPSSCGAPTAQRPPDPRCGEALDGRGEPDPSGARMVARGALWGPRLASRAVFWPIVKTSDLVESHHVLDWFEAILTTDDGLVGVRPIVQYTTGFLPTGGLRAFYRRLPGPGSELAGRFQTAGPAVMMGEVDMAGPDWAGLALRALWNRRDDRLFAGVGANSNADLALEGRGAARYGSDMLLAELRWSRPLPLHLALGLHGDAQRRDYRADAVRGGPSIASIFGLATPACAPDMPPTNACVDPALVPGFASGLRIVHAGSALTWDSRQHARDGGGLSALVDATVGRGVAGDPSRHVVFSGETVAAVAGTDRVLLLRGRAAVIRRLGSAPVPFEELVTPSGNTGMRGFPEGRFRGESGLVGSAEYRWYVAHNLDASLFTDVGTVAGPSFSGLGDARWFPTVGVGLRHYKVPGPYWEGDVDTGVQVAYAVDGGFRVLLSVATF